MANKTELLDMALEKLMGDMDELEGKGAMAHSLEECPDPLNCTMHDMEESHKLMPEDGKPAVSIEVHKMGMPTLDGEKAEGDGEKAEEGLSPEEAEELKKLLK